jgi:hypothetical protein
MGGALVIGGSKEQKEKLKKILDENKSRFIKIPTSAGMLIIDNKTGIEYFAAEAGFGGGISVLVDRDGKPLVNENF